MPKLWDFPFVFHTAGMTSNQLTRAKIQQIDRAIQTVGQLRKMRGYGGVKVFWVNDVPLVSSDGTGGSGDGSIFARITGRSGYFYSFVQVTNPGAGTPTDVTDGIVGTTSDGFATEINGVALDSLYTPNNQVFRLYPSPEVAGTWEFKYEGSLGFYAKLTGGTGPYSWTECTVSGGTVTGARTGVTNATEATTGLTGIPVDGSVVVWTTGSGSSYSFNAKMFTLVTSWTFSGSGSSCTITPATTKTVVISGPNLCGSTV